MNDLQNLLKETMKNKDEETYSGICNKAFDLALTQLNAAQQKEPSALKRMSRTHLIRKCNAIWKKLTVLFEAKDHTLEQLRQAFNDLNNVVSELPKEDFSESIALLEPIQKQLDELITNYSIKDMYLLRELVTDNIALYLPPSTIVSLMKTCSLFNNDRTLNKLLLNERVRRRKIAAGSDQTLILREDGKLLHCGCYDYDDDEDDPVYEMLTPDQDHLTPTLLQLPKKTIVRDIFAFDQNYWILTTDDLVFSFGCNDVYQLGLLHNQPRLQPTQVLALLGKKVKEVFPQFQYTLFLCQDGTLLGCGSNIFWSTGLEDELFSSTPTQIFLPENKKVKRIIIKGGGDWVFIITQDDLLLGWGSNKQGQLGIGNTELQRAPVQINLQDKKVNEVFAFYSFTLIHCTDGTWLGCGANEANLLELEDTKPQLHPVQINLFENKKIKQIIGNEEFILVLDEDGLLWCKGRDLGKWGLGSIKGQPMLIPIPLENKKVSQIIPSSNEDYVICEDGSLFFIGKYMSPDGQLKTTQSFMQVILPENLKAHQLIISSAYSKFIICKDGSLLAFCKNNQGQLGLGYKTPIITESKYDKDPKFVLKSNWGMDLTRSKQFSLSRKRVHFGESSSSSDRDATESNKRVALSPS